MGTSQERPNAGEQDPAQSGVTSGNVSIALTGSGGAGVVTAGQMLLGAAANAGLYGLMSRSSGPQIRGGESAAYVRLGSHPIDSIGNFFDILIAFDWMNLERFAAEIPLNKESLVLFDPAAGEMPTMIADSGARTQELPLKSMVKEIPGGRPNMVGLGAIASIIGLPEDAVKATLDKILKRKGEEALKASWSGVQAGIKATEAIESVVNLSSLSTSDAATRWNISGNEVAGLGAMRAGLKFVAAYPITPATDILEWLAPNLEKVGGALVQAEDELASINMIIGSSFGGVPSLTSTSGPGLALMMESIGLAVAAEIPIVIIDVMRGGPSTGIPTKSEQSDLNIALYGLHGDAPHLVTAPNSIGDCLFTTQWTLYLAEALQTPAIELSDQFLGQARVIIDQPTDVPFVAKRETMKSGEKDYCRYAVTKSGVSPMAFPGMAGGEHIADGLEHTPEGRPSSQAEDHIEQLEKRNRKLESFDYGNHWADIEGEGETAVVTWGSSTGPAREAVERLRKDGVSCRLISLRLLAPAQVDKFSRAIDGVKRLLVIEQSHSEQFFRYLKAHYDLPKDVKVLAQPGPLFIRPNQVYERLVNWSK
jgi:2-oxoglutarate/2-oxoacid ferredoxin oxidoreductase subunit alpha